MAKLDDKYINTIATSCYPPESLGEAKRRHEVRVEMEELRDRIRKAEMLDTAKDLGCQPIKLDDSFTGGYDSGFPTLSQREFDKLSSHLNSNTLSFENGSVISIIDTDGGLLTRGKVRFVEGERMMVDLLNLNKEEEEMTKIENRIKELEEKVYGLRSLKIKLNDALKLDSQSVTLMDKLKKAKYECDRFGGLFKGYQALDNMYVSEVFKNGDYVVVKTIYGETASSKPDKHDSFNMCSGFAFCNMKLGLDNDFYRHEINLALKDIEKRGL